MNNSSSREVMIPVWKSLHSPIAWGLLLYYINSTNCYVISRFLISFSQALYFFAGLIEKIKVDCNTSHFGLTFVEIWSVLLALIFHIKANLVLMIYLTVFLNLGISSQNEVMRNMFHMLALKLN